MNIQRTSTVKRKQMADFDDVSLDTSSNEGDFEGFTPDDVIKAIEKGAQLKQITKFTCIFPGCTS
jgi:hypothetical protein